MFGITGLTWKFRITYGTLLTFGYCDNGTPWRFGIMYGTPLDVRDKGLC